ncbi:MAG TPA: prephenate dehydratase domain-containing protein [Bacillota bacterium]|nr:bifunctional chorismate mutase/prephenate dehydratase [Clostridiales bacterium]HPT85098.1 prephenate dehydratase domain-containing protein [Bacillota bacterium]
MEIENLRMCINDIDGKLLELFLERMKLSEQVAEYKKQHGLPFTDRTREREILKRITERSAGYEQYAYSLFSMIIEMSKARQAELNKPQASVYELIKEAIMPAEVVFPRTGRIACQGIEGSNSQLACDKLFPRGNIMFFKSFSGVFDAVQSGLCDFGVLPIENSVNGSVRAVFDLLRVKKCYIVRGTTLHIRHELLALPGAELSDITEIYSHEQALGQCSKFIASLGGKVRAIPCENTAVAAKKVAELGDPHVAAISSARCAQLYGLKSLKSDIADSDNNYTRFVCISRKPVIYAGSGRICFVLGFDSRPGALSEVLLRFAARGINMTKLESFPVTGGDFDFNFIFELEASVHEPGVVDMLAELETAYPAFDFLGCYSYD